MFTKCDHCGLKFHGTLTTADNLTLCLVCAAGKQGLMALWERIKCLGLHKTLHTRANFLKIRDTAIKENEL